MNVFRDLLHRKLLKEDARLERQYGIPQHYGLLYAIGVALIMEGIMSACYHVCPNYSNFQFGQTSLFSVPDAIVLCTRHCSMYQMPWFCVPDITVLCTRCHSYVYQTSLSSVLDTIVLCTRYHNLIICVLDIMVLCTRHSAVYQTP